MPECQSYNLPAHFNNYHEMLFLLNYKQQTQRINVYARILTVLLTFTKLDSTQTYTHTFTSSLAISHKWWD